MSKRILTAIFSIVFLLSAHYITAQITVTDIHVVQSGRQIIQAQDTLPSTGMQPGSPGTNMTWDFSGLALHSEDTLNFVNPDWTPYEANHPTSNLAARAGSADFYLFLNNSPSGLFIQGFSGDVLGTGTAIHAPTVPNETLAEFPLSYSNSYTSVSGNDITIDGSVISALIDSIRLKTSKIKIVTVDAWGSVTTPMGTFDALRLNQTIQDTDSTWTLTFGMWSLFENSKSSTKNYAWWTNDAAAGFPLLDMEYDTVSGNPTSITYLKSTPAIGVAEESKLYVEVYPNPSSDQISFRFNNDEVRNIQIFSASGERQQLIRTTSNRLRLDVSCFSPGIYYYLVLNGPGKIQGSGNFVVY